MFSAFEWMVAGRYLRARRQEGFVSVIAALGFLGIALGVAALIIVMAVMNGFRHELLSRILGVNGHITVYGAGGTLDDFDPLAGELLRLDDVIRATPIVDGQVLATSARGATSGAMVRGMRAADLSDRAIIADAVSAGGLARFTAGEGVLVGHRLARKLGIDTGDRITLLSPKGVPTVFGTVPRSAAYTVSGTFDVGMYEYDSGFVYMPLDRAQIYFRMGEAVTGIELLVAEPTAIRSVRREVIATVGARGRVWDWQQANAQFFGAIKVERNVMFVILTLIILVAALNIVSSLIMLVKDKGRDIAILRTMGATRGMVMRIFFLTGASIGIVGTLMGFVLGVAFSANIETIRGWIEGLAGVDLFSAEIYFLSQLPARIDADEVILVVVIALALSFLATIYPAWRAARLDPVEALRYE
ncbi:MAG: lipoprotein-releasing ABC transporter permease subunit [Proteobacteria bacterium]|nr:lipoprotein-releasing ABC transporter permease subunit [Pseudomonadota bacterium]